MCSPVLKECDIKQIEPNNDDRFEGATRAKVDQGHFRGEVLKSQFSLGECHLAEYASGPTWPTPAPLRYTRRPHMLAAFMQCRGTFTDLKLAWLAKLVMPGHLLIRRLDVADAAYWVLGHTEWNVVAWSMKLKSAGGHKYVIPYLPTRQRPDVPWTRVFVKDTDAWYTCPIIATPPSVADEWLVRDEAPSEARGITMKLDTSIKPDSSTLWLQALNSGSNV